MRVVTVGYDHPDAQRLIEALQQDYVIRYGEPDQTPVDPAEFRAPLGRFLLGYLDDRPVASGGWRAHDSDVPGFRDGDAELKRMFIVPDERGNGLARRMLAELEKSAALAGRKRLVLETGLNQPEAIRLYESSGYSEIEKFGYYADDPLSRYFGKQI